MATIPAHGDLGEMPSAAGYIEALLARGQYSFTTHDAVCALGTSLAATRAALRRLKQKKLIAAPYRGFHVVVPPQYRRLGCLPADQFIAELMEHLGEPYYVGLLSAAAYHGAAHQAPMVFQVVVRRARRSLECGSVRVQFVARQDMEATPTVERNTATGVLHIASPEANAIELVGYPQHCGYLSNVATVLAELAEAMRGERLAKEARRAPLAWVQRLGYLLCLVEDDEFARPLDEVVAARDAFTVALAPWRSMKGAQRDARWRVAVNDDVEPDL